MAVQARRGTPADVSDMAAVLTEGFSKDPLLTWIYNNDARLYEKLALDFFTWLVERTLKIGDTYTVKGQAAGLGQLSTSVSVTPDEDRVIQQDLREVGGECADRLLAWMNGAAANHPLEREHWYGTYQAVLPQYRADGVGLLLFEMALREQDEGKGLPMYAEATTLRNLGSWAARGWQPIGTFTVGGEGGPSLTQIWREPTAK